MADTKISGLPASTTPLAGTEELPIVQSGVTRKVSVANLTAGRAVSATQMTLTTGSLIVASGQGIDFSATPGTGTGELLNDYEEGTWTPTDGSGAGLTFALSAGAYTKIGRMVYWQVVLLYPVTANGNGASIAGLPFSLALVSNVAGRAGSSITAATAATLVQSLQMATSNSVNFYKAGLVQSTNAELSGAEIYCAGFYSV